MAEPLRIERDVARRFLVMRHLLAPPRSLPARAESVMAVVERLGSLQFDPIDVAGRSHDLVLLARIDGYRREWTEALLYAERALFEAYNKSLNILPTSELPWYRITWDRSHRRHTAETFPEHADVVADLLERVRTGGPLSSTDVEAHPPIDWYWRPTNRVRALLEALAEAGVLGIARRAGNRRYYDLIERLYPPELLAVRHSEADQLRHKLLSRYRAHGLLGSGGQAEVWLGIRHYGGDHDGPSADGVVGATALRRRLREELVEAGTLVPVEVEGIRGPRYVIAEDLPLLARARREIADGTGPGGHAPGVAFLAPLDPFVWDRDFLRALFEFDYVWEVYVPPAKRRWGYYVLPVLFGDRLVGRIEPRFDRRAGRLQVVDVWWEEWFDPLAAPGFVEGFAHALEAHRVYGGARLVALPRLARHRPLVRAVRELLPGSRGPRTTVDRA